MSKIYTVNKSLYLSIDVEADSVSDAIEKAGEYSLDVYYEVLKSETLVFLGNDLVTDDDD